MCRATRGPERLRVFGTGTHASALERDSPDVTMCSRYFGCVVTDEQRCELVGQVFDCIKTVGVYQVLCTKAQLDENTGHKRRICNVLFIATTHVAASPARRQRPANRG
jgi:hypothetical protein